MLMFGFFETVFPVLFTAMFILFLVVFVGMIVRGLGQWNKNNHSPRLTVDAKVVTKRTNVSHHHNQNHMSHTSTSYYVTFEVKSGDRMELSMSGQEYGLMVEGDQGKLTFQGTRYLGFERGTEL